MREATNAQNAHNARMYANNTTGVKGVTFNRHAGKYHARVKLNYVSHNLGYFDTLEEADHAVRKKRHDLHGVFARDK